MSNNNVDTHIMDLVLAEFRKKGPVRKQNKGWNTRCPNPNHPDEHPSFTLFDNGGGYCNTKCGRYFAQSELLELLGINFPPKNPGLTVEEFAAAKGLPTDFLQSLGVRAGVFGKDRTPCVDIPYHDENGEEIAIRKRLALSGSKRFAWRRGDHPRLYGLEHLSDIRQQGRVVLVEGESDAWTLRYHNYPVLAVPGASLWKKEYAQLLDGLYVFVWKEPDDGGETMLRSISATLPEVFVITPPDGIKDPSALFLNDPENFRDHMDVLLKEALPIAQITQAAVANEAEALYPSAAPLLKDPAVLHRLVLASEKFGCCDDRRNVAALHLAVESRHQNKMISVIIQGPSSGGKSFLLESVLGIHPRTAAYKLTAMSERALAYTEETLEHRFLVLEEAAALNSGFFTYILRSMLSEGHLKYETVDKTSAGIKSRVIEKKGPTGFLATTTLTKLDNELATRVVTLEMKESPGHLRRILHAVAAQQEDDPEDGVPLEIEATLRWLELKGERRIAIPYASWLAEMLPVNGVSPRLSRDFTALLTAIKSSAFLHQAQRDKTSDGRIIANIADYANAIICFGEAFEQAGNDDITDSIRQAVDAVRYACQEQGTESCSVRKAGELMGRDRSTASRHLKAAADKGFLTNLSLRPGLPAQYVLGEPLPDVRSFFPTIDKLRAQFANLAGEWVHPLTGVCYTPAMTVHGCTGREGREVNGESPVGSNDSSPGVRTELSANSDTLSTNPCTCAANLEGNDTHVMTPEDVGEV